MSKMAVFACLAVVLIFFVSAGSEGVRCARRIRYAFSTRYSYIYCSGQCCGSLSNRYCCYTNVSGTIIGIVFACLAGLAIIAAVIICCIKSHTYRGRVIGTIPSRNPQPNVTVIYTGQNGHPGGAYPNPVHYPPVPPPYKARDPPPPYGYTDPAYPPGAMPENRAPLGFPPGQMPQQSQPHPAPSGTSIPAGMAPPPGQPPSYSATAPAPTGSRSTLPPINSGVPPPATAPYTGLTPGQSGGNPNSRTY